MQNLLQVSVSVLPVKQTRLDPGETTKWGNLIFFTEIFTRSEVFFTVKLTECQCK